LLRQEALVVQVDPKAMVQEAQVDIEFMQVHIIDHMLRQDIMVVGLEFM
jgi:hypothetical protein